MKVSPLTPEIQPAAMCHVLRLQYVLDYRSIRRNSLSSTKQTLGRTIRCLQNPSAKLQPTIQLHFTPNNLSFSEGHNSWGAASSLPLRAVVPSVMTGLEGQFSFKGAAVNHRAVSIFCLFSNFWIWFEVFRGILRVVWGWACFVMLNGGGIMSKFGLRVDLWWI